jgi:predicted RNA-binding protein YlxR (DUF448 family)
VIKRLPLRTCVGCQNQIPKRQLIRIVRTPEEIWQYDPTGKANGRGLYICRDINCLTRALHNKTLYKKYGFQLNPEQLDCLKPVLEGWQEV